MTATVAEPWTTARHPLARLLRGVAGGAFPTPDGAWTRVSPWVPQVQGIVALTGHAILAVSYDVPDAQLVDLGVDGWGGATNPRVVSKLAGEHGWVSGLDVLLVALGTGGRNASAPLAARPDLGHHPRVEFARRIRQDLQVMGRQDPSCTDVVVLGRGVAGLRELSVELEPGNRGAGAGEAIIRAGLDAVPENEVVVTCVAPGNAASLRATQNAGFAPIGAIQLFSTRPEHKL